MFAMLRSDIVEKNTTGDWDKGLKNWWRWDWLDKVVDVKKAADTSSSSGKSKVKDKVNNGKEENQAHEAVRTEKYSEHLEKLKEAGKAYCTLCRKEIS